MAHGGKRNGAGRHKGVPNKASALREQQIADTGPTPVDIMIEVMRNGVKWAQQERNRKKPSWRRLIDLERLALDAASKAAPFVHSRISAIAPSQKLDESKWTAEERAVVEPLLRKALV